MYTRVQMGHQIPFPLIHNPTLSLVSGTFPVAAAPFPAPPPLPPRRAPKSAAAPFARPSPARTAPLPSFASRTFSLGGLQRSSSFRSFCTLPTSGEPRRGRRKGSRGTFWRVKIGWHVSIGQKCMLYSPIYSCFPTLVANHRRPSTPSIAEARLPMGARSSNKAGQHVGMQCSHGSYDSAEHSLGGTSFPQRAQQREQPCPSLAARRSAATPHCSLVPPSAAPLRPSSSFARYQNPPQRVCGRALLSESPARRARAEVEDGNHLPLRFISSPTSLSYSIETDLCPLSTYVRSAVLRASVQVQRWRSTLDARFSPLTLLLSRARTLPKRHLEAQYEKQAPSRDTLGYGYLLRLL